MTTLISNPAPLMGPSLADSLPSVAFGFDDLRDRMSHFTSRFDEFISTGRRRVLESRNRFRINVADIHEHSRATQQKLDNLAQQSHTHASNIGREAAETVELQEAIGKLNIQKEERAIVKQKLLADIREVQGEIAVSQKEQKVYEERTEEQRRLNGPELRFWTDNLCMRIEACNDSSGKSAKLQSTVDRLKVVFTHVDEVQWEKEYWFDLEMSGGTGAGYNVGMTKPKLEREEIERVLEVMNTSCNLAKFLGGMRSLFVKATKDGR